MTEPDLHILADNILRAAGSSLRNYSMPATRKAILAATMAAVEAGRNEQGGEHICRCGQRVGPHHCAPADW